VIVDSGGGDYALRDGLFACGVFSALHRLGDRCPMACLAQLVNVLGAIEANPQQVVHTPLSHAFRLYGECSGPTAAPVSVDGPVIQIPRDGDCPALDVVASLSESGDRLYVIALNRLPVESVTARIELPGFIPAAAGKAVTLTGPDINATNTYAHPDLVGLQESAFEAAPVFEYTFGPHSATALVLQKN
jgi:alpha-N-arabinofuranosidase